MKQLTHSEARITVGRWRAAYFVPPDCPAPQELQERLDRVVAERLAEDCASCLEPHIDIADPAVWRIRRLAVNLCLAPEASDPQDVSRSWGGRIAADIHSIVAYAEPSDSVLRFPDGLTFVARFVFDLARNCAWESWYYEEFADLSILSPAQVVAAALLRHRVSPSALILELASRDRLEMVLSALGDTGARAIYELCFGQEPANAHHVEGLDKWTGSVLELWNESPLRALSQEENRFRDALRLYSRTLARYPDAEGNVQLKLAIDGLLELRRVLYAIRIASHIDCIVRNLASGDIQNAAALARTAGDQNPNVILAFFAERMRGDADWGAQAAAVILGDAHRQSYLTSKSISDGESFLSSFGGIFLLTASFQALCLADLTASAAGPSQSSEINAAILCHLAALKCLGQGRLIDASDDPALRLFSGFDGQSFRQVIEDMETSQLNLAAAQKLLLQSLVDPDSVHQLCLYGDLVSPPSGSAMFVLRELVRDEWLDAVPLSSAVSEVGAIVSASLRHVLAVRGAPHNSLFLSKSLASRMDLSHLTDFVEHTALTDSSDAALARLASRLGLTRDQLMIRLDSSEKQYSYFSFANAWPEFEAASSLDCAFSLVARAALRNFARRLPGFGFSSPEHLYQNFLAGLTEIRWIDGRLEVRLPPSPLSVILRMTGLQEQKFAPTWLKGAEVWLLPPQE
jgi:hypothetical protein